MEPWSKKLHPRNWGRSISVSAVINGWGKEEEEKEGEGKVRGAEVGPMTSEERRPCSQEAFSSRVAFLE